MGERTTTIRVPSDPDLDTARNSDEIAAKIDQTRAEMSETVEALQNKLAPERMLDDFLNAARDSVDRNVERILDTMREHPVVTSLTGLGVGWLLLQGTARRDLAGRNYPTDGDYVDFTDGECSSAGEPVGDQAARFTETMSAGTAAAREKVAQLASGARDKAAHLAGRAGEQAAHVTARAAGYAKQQAGSMASKARDQAGYVADRARQQMGSIGMAAAGQARQAAHRAGDMVYENPFAVAAVGVAMGAAIGFLIPETRREGELMGELRDTMLDKAKATASDTMERAKRVAEAAKDAATQEAQKQNLSAESLSRQAGAVAELGKSLMDKVEDTVTSAAGAAREEAKRQGLSSEHAHAAGKGYGDMRGTTSASAAKEALRTICAERAAESDAAPPARFNAASAEEVPSRVIQMG